MSSLYHFSSWVNAGNTPTFTLASKNEEALNQTYFFNAYSVSSFCVNSIDKYCVIQSDLKLASPFKGKQVMLNIQNLG